MSALGRKFRQVIVSAGKKARVASNKMNTQSAALIIDRKLVDKTSVVIVYADSKDSFLYTCIFRNKPKNKSYDTLYVSDWMNLSLNLNKNISKTTLLNRIKKRIVGKRMNYSRLITHLDKHLEKSIMNPNEKLDMILKPLKMSKNRPKTNTNDIDDLQLYGKKSFFNYSYIYGSIHLYMDGVKNNNPTPIKNNKNNTPMNINKNQRGYLTNEQKQNMIKASKQRANKILNIQIEKVKKWYETSGARNTFPQYPLFR